MSDEQAPNTPRRSARTTLPQERPATQVSPREELPAADTITTEQRLDGEIVDATVLVPMDTGKPNVLCPHSITVIQAESNDSKDPCKFYEQRQGPPCEIRYFRPYRDPFAPRQINELVRTLVVTPFDLRSVGYIYCFKHPGDNDVDDRLGPEVLTVIHPVKIGRTRQVPRRIKQWRARCRYEPAVQFAHRMAEHERVEAIVHAQLHNERRKEHRGCASCGSRHDEWFDVGVEDAEYLVRLWQRFAGHRVCPYDASGGLVPRWRERLQSADMNDANCWSWFTHWDPTD